jgi:hypothetical protein
MTADYILDPEFRDLLPRHNPQEKQALRKLIKDREHVDPGVVGVIQGDRVLVDGYTREEICADEGIPFPTREVHFEDRQAAKDWIIDNQYGRRNLTDEQRAYFRGKEYLAAKGKPLPQNEGTGGAAKKVAGKRKVSKATVERDAEFAKGADKLTPEARKKLLEGGGQTKAQVATGIFCDRCERAGPSKNCKACAALREEANKKKKAAKVKSPSGQVKFDWRKWEAEFGALYRQVDKLAGGYKDKAKENDRGDEMREHLKQFKAGMRQWYRELSGQKPPTE